MLGLGWGLGRQKKEGRTFVQVVFILTHDPLERALSLVFFFLAAIAVTV
jgi:hypothetical protein